MDGERGEPHTEAVIPGALTLPARPPTGGQRHVGTRPHRGRASRR